MFKIVDKPFFKELKEFVSSDAQVSINLSDPYYSDPFTIRINITQMTNPRLVAGVSWRILPISETELPELNTTTNSVSFIADYNIPSLVVELTVALKDGNFQYYHVPVVIDDVPPFESACQHEGQYLSICTDQDNVRFDIDGVSTGDINLNERNNGETLFITPTVVLRYFAEAYEPYIHSIKISSGGWSGPGDIVVPTTIKFYPEPEQPYRVGSDMSNFPYSFNNDGEWWISDELDLLSLPYNYSEYFLATNCCFYPRPGNT